MAPKLNRYGGPCHVVNPVSQRENEAAYTIHPRDQHVIARAAAWQRAQLRSVHEKRAALQDGCSQC